MNQNPILKITQSESPSYGVRTRENARLAQITVACAVDMKSAGEKLTFKASRYYVGKELKSTDGANEAKSFASLVAKEMREEGFKHINFAGNSILTFSKHGWDQQRVNQWVYTFMAELHKQIGLESVRSGGQTGADVAGIIAAVKLGIPATAHYPKGLVMRGLSGRDQSYEESLIRQRIMDSIDQLK